VLDLLICRILVDADYFKKNAINPPLRIILKIIPLDLSFAGKFYGKNGLSQSVSYVTLYGALILGDCQKLSWLKQLQAVLFSLISV
jgi:hypothetical protein